MNDCLSDHFVQKFLKKSILKLKNTLLGYFAEIFQYDKEMEKTLTEYLS